MTNLYYMNSNNLRYVRTSVLTRPIFIANSNSSPSLSPAHADVMYEVGFGWVEDMEERIRE